LASAQAELPVRTDTTVKLLPPHEAEPNELPAQKTAAPALEKVPLPPVRLAATEPAQPEFGIAFTGASTIEVARLQ
jgi:hypothetical protein